MSSEPAPDAQGPPRSGSESLAPALSGSESQAPALSFWLQLMLAEIGAKRTALESARAEEARRESERRTATGDTEGGAPRS